jgi:adenosylhomocysteine nucleosidase
VNRENADLCVIFPLGMEAYPFLRRVQVLRRWQKGKATYREVFFEGKVFLTVRCGIGPEKAAAAVRNLGCRPSVIVCAGTAGSLVPDLKRRELIVSSETVFGHEPREVVASAAHLVDALAEACCGEALPHRVARLATVTRAVFPIEERRMLHAATGAHGVDMESHAMNLEASSIGVPFASLRVVSDDFASPPLPDSRNFKAMWKRPATIPRELVKYLRWVTFLRDFRGAVEALHPVLVRLIRDTKATGQSQVGQMQ